MARTREIVLPWRQQPQRAVGIDWRNPITRDLVFAFESPRPLFDATGTVPMAITSSFVTTRACEYGLATNYTGAQPDLSCASVAGFGGLDNATANTFDILVRFNGANPTCKLFSQWDGTGQRWTAEFSAGKLVWVAGDKNGAGTNRSRFDLASAATSAGWYRIQGAWAGAGNAVVLINGIERSLSVMSSACTILDPTDKQIQVGASAGQRLNGQVVFARLWRRALSIDELRETYANPWSLFAPRRRRIPAYSAAPSAVPSITFVGAENITSNSASYRVTLNYA